MAYKLNPQDVVSEAPLLCHTNAKNPTDSFMWLTFTHSDSGNEAQEFFWESPGKFFCELLLGGTALGAVGIVEPE